MKWKDFFMTLEASHGLDPQSPSHIWLLHWLFLNAINDDAQEWMAAWNMHTMDIRGEPSQTPQAMFTFSMVENGPRGIQALLEQEHLTPEEIVNYGIDWDVQNDTQLYRHFLTNNPHEQSTEPFDSTSTPHNLTHIICDPPNCPFSDQEIQDLRDGLRNRVDMDSRNMAVRRLIWQEALFLCRDITTGNSE
jgi:hypothetical protein